VGQDWPIWTYSESVPPAKFIHDEDDRRGRRSVDGGGGCIISGTQVRNSLLFTMVHTNSYASSIHSVVLPYVYVARHARLTQRGDRPRRADPRGPCRGRGPRRGRALVPRQPKGA
jgi:glucose-1-phosphate adenylyltransferase